MLLNAAFYVLLTAAVNMELVLPEPVKIVYIKDNKVKRRIGKK